MPQVAGDVARARAAQLRERSATRRRAWLRGMIGSEQPIVLEKPGDRGHAPGFADVRLAETQPVSAIGKIFSVRVAQATDDYLIGTIE